MLKLMSLSELVSSSISLSLSLSLSRSLARSQSFFVSCLGMSVFGMVVGSPEKKVTLVVGTVSYNVLAMVPM